MVESHTFPPMAALATPSSSPLFVTGRGDRAESLLLPSSSSSAAAAAFVTALAAAADAAEDGRGGGTRRRRACRFRTSYSRRNNGGLVNSCHTD